MSIETQVIEYKSLKKITGKNPDFKGLAETCVCLANLQGGIIVIGIEDGDKNPPIGQKIEQKLVNNTIKKLRDLTDSVGLVDPRILTHSNGAEYFQFNVLPSKNTIAVTSSGKVLIRVGDSCSPVSGNELISIVEEKTAFQWELVTKKSVDITNISKEAIAKFATDIRTSSRVKNSVKQLSDLEIIEHYNFTDSNYLTNLGVLWLGNATQRSRIAYPVSIQYIVYDEYGNKIRKEYWHDNTLNPKDLLLEVEQEARELKYFYEFPDGLFRKKIYHYDPRLIRELLINAIAHRKYTIAGDIFIEIYPDHLEIKNPGRLPLGIDKYNILHKRNPRNIHLIRTLHDLELMEAEGSGYDLIYEIDSRDSKPFPDIITDFDSTTVIQSSKIIDEESIYLLDYIAKHFQLSQRGFIALGIIARHKKILSTQLAKTLQLSSEKRMDFFVGKLLEEYIIVKQGVKKATAYLINPKLISDSKLNIKPNLKTIEKHRLKALIEEDVKMYPNSSAREIQERLKDIPLEDLQKVIYAMVDEGTLGHSNGKTYRKYFFSCKKGKE